MPTSRSKPSEECNVLHRGYSFQNMVLFGHINIDFIKGELYLNILEEEELSFGITPSFTQNVIHVSFQNDQKQYSFVSFKYSGCNSKN